MKYLGQCHCEKNEVLVETFIDFEKLLPRKCDCNSCRSLSLPAAMISDPGLNISILEGGCGLQTKSNGSEQALFFHCKNCEQLLAVGATIEGVYRGAVNSCLFKSIKFGQATLIRPRLLSPAEKVQRWKDIWGNLQIVKLSL